MSATAPSVELVVDVDGFEGPIALLLDLARSHKIDLKQISILALADQYLAFIEQAHAIELELAADYLVMAAWLAYLKSRLLLPEPPAENEASVIELADALAFRLRRLEAMQAAGNALFELPLLGRDRFARGAPEGLARRGIVFTCDLNDLLRAYGGQIGRQNIETLRIEAPAYHTVEDALRRLSALLGTAVEWRSLIAFLPPQWTDARTRPSAIAALFAASLELAKAGRLELQQEQAFAPLMLRASRPSA